MQSGDAHASAAAIQVKRVIVVVSEGTSGCRAAQYGRPTGTASRAHRLCDGDATVRREGDGEDAEATAAGRFRSARPVRWTRLYPGNTRLNVPHSHDELENVSVGREQTDSGESRTAAFGVIRLA